MLRSLQDVIQEQEEQFILSFTVDPGSFSAQVQNASSKPFIIIANDDALAFNAVVSHEVLEEGRDLTLYILRGQNALGAINVGGMPP